MTSSAHTSRETTPNRVHAMTSPFHELADTPTSPFHELANPPNRMSRLITPIGLAAAYATYQIYNKFKKKDKPKRNTTMSIMKNRF